MWPASSPRPPPVQYYTFLNTQKHRRYAMSVVTVAREQISNEAKALAFAVDAEQVFAKHVNLPAVTMPERSYLRSSLAEMAGEIRKG